MGTAHLDIYLRAASQRVFKPTNITQDGAPKIAKLPYNWFNYGLWYGYICNCS